jgi:glycine/D-amino acid oxidase-like deaminating enzyme
MTTPHIIIIGSGIMGACFAYAAAERGLSPVVIASDAPDNGKTGTATSWAWINANSASDKAYFQLRHNSMQRWQSWMQRLDGLTYSAQDSYCWDLTPNQIQSTANRLQEWGLPCSVLNAATLITHLPRLRDIPIAALHVPMEGAVEPVSTANLLLKASGAQIIKAHVHSLLGTTDSITGIMTDQGAFMADEIVLAAGNGTPRILDTIDIDYPMETTNGLLVRSKPIPPMLTGLVIAPKFHVRQQPDGSLLIGGSFGPYAPENGTGQLANDAEKQLDLIRSAFDTPAPLELDSFTLGQRPIPKGGMPTIGRIRTSTGDSINGIYLAVMHSGFSNGAGVAENAMDELLDGATQPLFESFRFNRVN